MYPKKIICALILYMSTNAAAFSINNDSLGLPGDNLDLYGVLDLFKKSANPEEFEKALNAKDNGVNNLDLDGDGFIDYINVEDHAEKNAHAMILQVAVNEKEIQDVAVIEVQRNEDGTANIQVVGDEALYGKNYIIEPSSNEKTTPAPRERNSNVVMVNVWGWPSVNYLYGPSYVMWSSPWRWRHYPVWFAPWRPLGWGIYYGNVYRYHPYHERVFINRVVYANHIYYGHRSYSPTIYQRRGMDAPVYNRRNAVQAPVNRSRTTNQHPVERNFQRRSQPSPNQSNNGVRNSAPHTSPQMHSEPRSSSPRSSAVLRTSGAAGHSGGGHNGGGHSGARHGGRK